MKRKNIIKSPWCILLLLLCAMLTCTLFIVITCNQEKTVNDTANAALPQNDEVIVLPNTSPTVTPEASPPDEPSSAINDTSSELPPPSAESENNNYVSTARVKENVLLDALLTEDDVDFVSIELNENDSVPVYEVVFETKDQYRKYIYQVNAATGLLRSRTYYNADDVWDEENIFMKHEGRNAKWHDIIWEEGIPDGKRGSQSFYNEPVYVEEE